MSNFYTSEILILPKKLSTLDSSEQLLALQKLVADYLTKHKTINPLQNLHFFNQDLVNFPIEEVRRLQTELGYQASLSGQKDRVMVLLNFDSASLAAQNAALKIIEESPVQTLLLLTVYKIEQILDTILSRCLVISLEREEPLATASTIEQSLTNLPQDYSQAIELASQYKDRQQASELIENYLKTATMNHRQKKILLTAYQDLNHQQNSQLVLENCFFSLVSLES